MQKSIKVQSHLMLLHEILQAIESGTTCDKIPFCFVVKLRISAHIEVTAKSRGLNSRVKVHRTRTRLKILVGKFCHRKSIIVPIPIEMTGFHLQNSMSHLTVPTCDCTFIHNICCMQSCTLQFIHELQNTYNYQYVLFLHRLLLKLGHRFIRGSAIALTLQLFTLTTA